jgi:hypothetical protein
MSVRIRLSSHSGWGGNSKRYFFFIECSDQDLRITDWAKATDASTGTPWPD